MQMDLYKYSPWAHPLKLLLVKFRICILYVQSEHAMLQKTSGRRHSYTNTETFGQQKCVISVRQY